MTTSLPTPSANLQLALAEVAYEQLVSFVGPDATRERASVALDVWRLGPAVDDATRTIVLGRFWPAAVAVLS